MKNILLISKEVLRPDYLSCYGGKLYNTVNIDKLAEQGTVFTNFYTAAPSSAMAFTAMFTGLYPFETRRKSYREVKRFDQCPTLSDLLEEMGYEIHVVWGGKWFRGSYKRSRVFSSTTQFHNLEDIYQLVGPHRSAKDREEDKVRADPLDSIYEIVKKIFANKKHPVFIWLHCPHVFVGRPGYGSDIDLFDKLVGMLFNFFFLDEIFLTGDHGHMNFERGILAYGFHVYEGAIKIPLLTPNYFDRSIIDQPVSNVQLKELILNKKIEYKDFIYSDTQYYLQENRKLMIRKGDFKYIFNKKDNSEELYDIRYDPQENANLLIEKWIDRDRHMLYNLEEIFYYPRWAEAETAYRELKREKDRIWKKGKFLEEMFFKLNVYRKKGLPTLEKSTINRKNRIKGRWESLARIMKYEI